MGSGRNRGRSIAAGIHPAGTGEQPRPSRLLSATWNGLTPRQQSVVLVLASVQLSLAATAWADLVVRSARQVNGPKGAWAAVIAVSFLGPALYFARGVRRPR